MYMVSGFALADVRDPTSANPLNQRTNKILGDLLLTEFNKRNIFLVFLNNTDMQHGYTLWACSMSMQPGHEARTSSMSKSMLHVHIQDGFTACPCSMDIKPGQVAYLCCMSLRHLIECPCCMPMLLVNVACLCCMSMLHDNFACPCSLSNLHVFAACPCCMSVLQ